MKYDLVLVADQPDGRGEIIEQDGIEVVFPEIEEDLGAKGSKGEASMARAA